MLLKCSALVIFCCVFEQSHAAFSFLSYLADECTSEYTKIPNHPSCYKLHRQLRTWGDASAICQEEGANLIVPETPAEIALIGETLFQDEDVFYTWCGVFRRKSKFISVTGEKLSDFWTLVDVPGSPSTHPYIFYQQATNSGLNTGTAKEVHSFICVKQPSDTP